MFACGAQPKVSIVDPYAAASITNNFSGGDLNAAVKNLSDSLLRSKNMSEVFQARQPVMFLGHLENRTAEHIDVRALGESMLTELSKAGAFRVVDMNRMDDILNQIEIQNYRSLVNPDTALKAGNLVGAEYMLYGSLSSIEQRSSRSKESYYKLNLKLLNLEQGIVTWTDEYQVRKLSRKKMIGW
jgi:hypothetical protein